MRKTTEEFMNELKKNYEVSDEEMSKASGGASPIGSPLPKFKPGDRVKVGDSYVIEAYVLRIR